MWRDEKESISDYIAVVLYNGASLIPFHSHVSSLWDLHISSWVALVSPPQVSVICKIKPTGNTFTANNDTCWFPLSPFVALDGHDFHFTPKIRGERCISLKGWMLLDRLTIAPSSVFIKSTQQEITVSAVFSWKTLISYTIFIITQFIKNFSNSLLTDHIHLVVCIRGRQCKRLNCWWLLRCNSRNYYDAWNCSLLSSLLVYIFLHPSKWLSAWVSVFIGREYSAFPTLLLENVFLSNSANLWRKQNPQSTVHEHSFHWMLINYKCI